MKTRLVRLCEYRYAVHVVENGADRIIGEIERLPLPGNGHFSIWIVKGHTGHFPTRRDALEWLVGSMHAREGAL